MKKSIMISLVAIGQIVACARVRAEDTGAGKQNPAVTPASRDEKWKKETMLVSPKGDQTVVRSCANRKILFQNADPQLAIEWGWQMRAPPSCWPASMSSLTASISHVTM